MDCTMEKNQGYCTCTYASCSKKYKCCECLHYHRKMDQLPACYFSKDYEKTYDRSVANFLKMRGR